MSTKMHKEHVGNLVERLVQHPMCGILDNDIELVRDAPNAKHMIEHSFSSNVTTPASQSVMVFSPSELIEMTFSRQDGDTVLSKILMSFT